MNQSGEGMTGHQHSLVKDAAGRDTCTVCSQVVWNPIVDPSDERLQESGFMRTPRPDALPEVYPPLPEMLIALYYNGQAIGVFNAPVAQYIEHTAMYEGNRSHGTVDPENIWDDLYELWYTKHQISK